MARVYIDKPGDMRYDGLQELQERIVKHIHASVGINVEYSVPKFYYMELTHSRGIIWIRAEFILTSTDLNHTVFPHVIRAWEYGFNGEHGSQWKLGDLNPLYKIEFFFREGVLP